MTDEEGKVISQLCDKDNTLGSKEFEQAMRKQAEMAVLRERIPEHWGGIREGRGLLEVQINWGLVVGSTGWGKMRD